MISLLIHYILVFLAGIIFSAIFYGQDTKTYNNFCIFLTNLSNALLIVFDKISFPIHFILPFLAGKDVQRFFIFNLWFSALVLSKISLQIQFILTILAGIFFLAIYMYIIFKIYHTNLSKSYKIEYLVRYSFRFNSSSHSLQV